MSKVEDNGMPWKAEIIRCAKAYLEANDAWRKNPCAVQSCGPRDTPEWEEYAVLRKAYEKAVSDLWMATDIEYEEDGFRDVVWDWRYWKVMSRKCCWYQTSVWGSHMAAKTMRCLQDAETKLMEICGLDNYKPSSYYIERMFPKLKSE